jgi:REP element-mobilizing transposase RayT
MAQSLSKVLIHLIFSTKNREPLIDAAVEPRLHAYMAGIFQEMESPAVLIGGTSDHVHSLFVLSRNKALSEVIMQVKRGSSKWIKEQGGSYGGFYWQNGYGAFSVGESAVPQLKTYIGKQRDHHKRVSFQDEFRTFLRKYGVQYDERYVWD